MRVLHLIDAESPQATPTTLALLNESIGRLGRIEQHILLLGGGSLRDAARAAGLVDVHTAVVPFGQALMGWPTVHRFIHDRGPFDLIHCWSVGTFTLASLAFRSIPRVLTLTTTPTERSVRWLRLLTSDALGRCAIIPISATLRRAVLGGGVAEPLVQVLRPGLDFGKVAADRRAALRESWGIGPEEDKKIKVVALLSDPPWASDADAAHMGLGLADEVYVTGEGRCDRPELRLLIHPANLNRARATRAAVRVNRPLRMIQEPGLSRPWEVLPGCDIAMTLGPNSGGLSLLWAMAANVPIVAEATYGVSEIVEDRHSALLAKPGYPPRLAYRITQIVADEHLAWKLRDTARHEAFSFFSRLRYCQSLQGVYEQLLEGKAIDVEPLPSTGGLRFSGRG